MRFDDRTYPDIVRDLLTLLTGGTVAEVHPVPPEGLSEVVLHQRPVRRVSHLQGKVQVGDELVDYRFTERDFELVGTAKQPDAYGALRFRPRRRQPAPGTTLTVNYYPLRTRPTPLTDINVGSVVRTLLETVARELAGQYLQLQRVYESAFVGTARGTSLDNVVALVGVRRLKRGHPVGQARFWRRQGSAGSIYVPINTVIRDNKGARYRTSAEATVMPNQAWVDVWVQGESPRSPLVQPGALSTLERAIAGIERVSNEEPTYFAKEDEQDDQLATRARSATHTAGKGTLSALRYALESQPFISGVTLSEYTGQADSPVVAPGILRVDVALNQDTAAHRAIIDELIAEMRPAGIYVEWRAAGKLEVGFSVQLRLAGASLQASALTQLQSEVSARLEGYVRGLAPGDTLRRTRVVSLILQDERIVDTTVTITTDGQALTQDTFTLPAGKAAQPAAVQFSPVTFDEQPRPGEGPTLQVDADLRASALKGTVDEARKALELRLKALLAELHGGDSLTFERVANALRDPSASAADAKYVLSLPACVLALEGEGGTFSELRQGGTFTLPTGATLTLRKLELTPP